MNQDRTLFFIREKTSMQNKLLIIDDSRPCIVAQNSNRNAPGVFIQADTIKIFWFELQEVREAMKVTTQNRQRMT